MRKHKKKHDNRIACELKEALQGIVTEMASEPSSFIIDPARDFTRRRKLDMETLVNLILSMKGGSISKELYTYFGGDVEAATSSAFVQQRAKIIADAFEYLFRKFNDESSHLDTNTYEGYHLLAVDGSDINIAKNPESDTYFVKSDYNQFHLNAVYDALNKTYFDALIQPAPKEHEIRAAISMITRNEFRDKAIIIADRGYECFGLYEHIHRTDNLDCLIRVKNKGTKEVRDMPMADWDIDVSFELRTTQTRQDQKDFAEGKAKFVRGPSKRGIDKQVTWDFESPFMFSYRVVRFEISPGEYETLVTSLDREAFPLEKLKELYHLRWGIETSFRELKYAIGVLNFHARREDFILQEIYAMFTMYNFCERITMSVVIEQVDGRLHTYQVNFTMAIHICRDFFALPSYRPPPDVSSLIARHILPVREGRSDKRKLNKRMNPIMFTYRVAA